VNLVDRVRASCREVAECAQHVSINEDRLAAYARALPTGEQRTPTFDPEHHFSRPDDPASTVGYLLCLDSINFGSGWFPKLTKRPGMSGYFTVSSALRDQFERRPWTPEDLAELDPGQVASVLGQQGNLDVADLMVLFAQALNDLGHWVGDRFDGSYLGVTAAAGHSAVRLVELLIEMPLFRDHDDYRSDQGPIDVWFLKRAQLTAVDLALALDGSGPGRFDDLDRLTIFADNLVPHVLRTDGLLAYDQALASRIQSGELIAPGSPEEIEIRAASVHTVELLVEHLDGAATAAGLDFWLWNRGQQSRYRELPRHRCRTTSY